ncbi:LlaMI family restriction endonuclease [Malaciobacter mytili]|uniref:LlaMI family restriction endonuclease n=1 Tax=Malaciobacter mytili TaxID=603050 RepID=UPI003BB01246
MTDRKKEIIKRFEENVKGKIPQINGVNVKHDGKEGHWLETQMGITHNANNEPDLFGYEMKNQTTSGKTTFGDWSADEYIYIHGRKNKGINDLNKEYLITRNQFLFIFGKENISKNNRVSWSGEPCPTYYGDTTTFGQTLTMDNDENIIIVYDYSKDVRYNKSTIVPLNMQKDGLLIAKWYKETLKSKLEKKFNINGWFTCTKNGLGEYEKIHFGPSIDYQTWINLFKQRVVFFDSGMYYGNNRPYSQWRAMNTFWKQLIEETY